jgi:putative NIF3 family GTP cyclohydrolase 1 type 2
MQSDEAHHSAAHSPENVAAPIGADEAAQALSRNEALTPKQFPQQPQRRGLVALGLDQDFENLAFAVDCAPHVHLPSSD